MVALVREQGSIIQMSTVVDGETLYSYEITPMRRVNEAGLSVLDKLMNSPLVHSSRFTPGANGAVTVTSRQNQTFSICGLFPNFNFHGMSPRNPDADLAGKFDKLKMN